MPRRISNPQSQVRLMSVDTQPVVELSKTEIEKRPVDLDVISIYSPSSHMLISDANSYCPDLDEAIKSGSLKLGDIVLEYRPIYTNIEINVVRRTSFSEELPEQRIVGTETRQYAHSYPIYWKATENGWIQLTQSEVYNG